MKLALLAALLATTVTAGPADVCIEQAKCVDFSVEKIDEAVSPSHSNPAPPIHIPYVPLLTLYIDYRAAATRATTRSVSRLRRVSDVSKTVP
jgi:hypothetical protein